MKKLKYIALILALLASLAANVATVAFSSFALLLSSAFEAVTGTSAVVSDLRRRNALKETKIKDLNADLDLKERRSTKLSGELAQNKQRVSSLTNDLAASENKRKSLAKDLDVRSSQVASLTDDLATSETKRRVLTKDLDAKGSRVSTLAAEIDVRDRRIADLSATIENPKVTYRNQQRPLNEAVTETVERISTRTANGAKRNIAAMFGEGIPLVGVGVAVAVTGYEIKDNCDTLEDLRELELSIDPSTALSDDAQEVCGMPVPSSEEVWKTVSNSPSVAWEKAGEYMPDLGELHLPEISIGDGWEKAKEGTSSLWGSAKSTASATLSGIGDGFGAAWEKMFGD